MKKVAAATLVLIAGILAAAALLLAASAEESAVVELAGATVEVEVADQPQTRDIGLSGRAALEGDAGMLFMFDRPARHGIWMKDMRFEIDILWMDANRRVVYIVEDARPDSYPATTFSSPEPAVYVLEVNSGFVERHGVSIGDEADFRL